MPLWVVPLAAAAGWTVGFLPQLVHPRRLLVATTLAELVSYALLTAALGGLAAGLRRDRPLSAALLAIAGAGAAAFVGLSLASGPPAVNQELLSGLHRTALVTTIIGLAAGVAAALGPVPMRAPMLAAPAVCVPAWLESLFSVDLPQAFTSALLAGALVLVLVTSVRRSVDVVAWLPAWILGWLMQAVSVVLVSVGVLIGQGHHVNTSLFTSRFLYFHELWNEPAAHYPIGWVVGGLLALAVVGYKLRGQIHL